MLRVDGQTSQKLSCNESRGREKKKRERVGERPRKRWMFFPWNATLKGTNETMDSKEKESFGVANCLALTIIPLVTVFTGSVKKSCVTYNSLLGVKDFPRGDTHVTFPDRYSCSLGWKQTRTIADPGSINPHSFSQWWFPSRTHARTHDHTLPPTD